MTAIPVAELFAYIFKGAILVFILTEVTIFTIDFFSSESKKFTVEYKENGRSKQKTFAKLESAQRFIAETPTASERIFTKTL